MPPALLVIALPCAAILIVASCGSGASYTWLQKLQHSIVRFSVAWHPAWHPALNNISCFFFCGGGIEQRTVMKAAT